MHTPVHATVSRSQFRTVILLYLLCANSAIAQPGAFQSDGDFLEYVQQTAFDYFWREANPQNGLIRDRSQTKSPCSIAAVGFGLTAIGIGIDHGWITRDQGRERTVRTLKTFWDGPQGTNTAGIIGYKGWFYHFLDLQTATRTWRCELSSIDTALFLAGALSAKQYFDQDHPDESTVRSLVDALFNRVDWNWITDSRPLLSHGWMPESGFLRHSWTGYNEAMILYLLAIGAQRNAVPPSQWQEWTKTYRWETHYGHSYVNFPPLFGHQYSHCWVDFRGIADEYMAGKNISYFENSRRATLAQREYCIANPKRFAGYGSNGWGLTACDGPGKNGYRGYSARGAPPSENDDGTLAPTAVGGSIVFAPGHCVAALRHLYDEYHPQIWCSYGFRDAFNLQASWWDPDVIGIDQGPILLMIENHRTEKVWRRFMKNPEIQHGLKLAGFRPLLNSRGP